MADYRSSPNPSPDGPGIARKAWETWADATNAAAAPLMKHVAGRLSATMAADMFGFWLTWHLEGGFEGLERMGMNRSTIFRKIKRFRDTMGVHPDEYELPGVTIDVSKYLGTISE